MTSSRKLALSLFLFGFLSSLFGNTLCQDASNSTLPIDDYEAKMMRKFQNFMVKYNKQYSSMEELKQRFEIFKENYKNAKSQSVNAENPEDSVRFGTSPFIDMTPEEFGKVYLNPVKPEDVVIPEAAEVYSDEVERKIAEETGTITPERAATRNLQNVSAPANFDWRNYGIVTSVKNQGQCGGCWAFSAAANIEGLYARKYGRLVSFSEQQMLDCDYSNAGCVGGIMDKAFNYIRNAGGLMTYSSYPFIGYKSYCRFNQRDAVAGVSGYIFAGSNNEDTIMRMLYTIGPLSITMNASTIQFYKGGVYNVPYAYCPYAPDHGVTLVGYGVTSTGLPYWTIKNSWGPYWGESGFFRIARGRGLCGVNQYVISARLA